MVRVSGVFTRRLVQCCITEATRGHLSASVIKEGRGEERVPPVRCGDERRSTRVGVWCLLSVPCGRVATMCSAVKAWASSSVCGRRVV